MMKKDSSKRSKRKGGRSKSNVFGAPLVLGILFVVLLVAMALLASWTGQQERLKTALPPGAVPTGQVDTCPMGENAMKYEFIPKVKDANENIQLMELEESGVADERRNRAGVMNELVAAARKKLNDLARYELGMSQIIDEFKLTGLYDFNGDGKRLFAADVFCQRAGEKLDPEKLDPDKINCPKGCDATGAKNPSYRAVEPEKGDPEYKWGNFSVTDKTCPKRLDGTYRCTATASLKCERELHCKSLCGKTIEEKFTATDEQYEDVEEDDNRTKAEDDAVLTIRARAARWAGAGDEMCGEAAKNKELQECNWRCPATESPKITVPSKELTVQVSCVERESSPKFKCTATGWFDCERKLTCPALPSPTASFSPSSTPAPSSSTSSAPQPS